VVGTIAGADIEAQRDPPRSEERHDLLSAVRRPELTSSGRLAVALAGSLDGLSVDGSLKTTSLFDTLGIAGLSSVLADLPCL
jgi:hypothetical protein